MNLEPSRILIVGAGIGGLALALALRRNGVNASVWERARELREIGAGLLLTPNAAGVLQRLDLFEQAARSARIVRQWQILDRRGRVLQTFVSKPGDLPSLSITRSAFQQLLLAAIPPGAVLLDREVVAMAPDAADEKITVSSAQGDTATVNLLVGADGGRSIVRKLALDARPSRVLGYVGWRGLVDQIPAGWEHGRITESWGDGGRFGIAPVGAGRTYWYATENVSSAWAIAPEKRKAHLLERYCRWHAPICDLIEATHDEEILLSEISEHPRLRRWHQGRTALLGDAAHFMTPNLGQGAAMALEDAWVLAGCLRDFGCREQALRRYERLRNLRTAGIVWMSRQVGRMIQLEHPALESLRDAALRLMPDWIGVRALAPIFDFRA